MLKPNVETFFGCDAPYADATIVLYGAPYDSTTSYRPGTRFGSSSIRHEVFGLESYSPYQDKDLLDIKIFDSGDIELPFGDTARALDLIGERTKTILQDGKLPFLVGGEHLVSLAAIRAAAQRYPNLAIVHFDAHADLREDYLGTKLSHACVLRRAHELVGDNSIFQFGIRSGDHDEIKWGKNHVSTHFFDFETLGATLESLATRPVYFSLDLDVLDPSVFPGTGTPEPGGVSFDALRQAATLVCKTANVIACDAVELSPHYDPSGVSSIVAGKVIREMLLALSV